MQGENSELKRFLLGSESEKEAEEIGVRIISDTAFAEKMAFVEEDLIEDFLDDALTAEEKELFHKNFLTTAARVELLEETALLRNYARNHPSEVSARADEEKKPGGFFDSLREFLTLNLRPIAAVLIILVIGAVVWRIAFYDAGGLSDIEKQYAALNANDLNNPSETANLSNKSLIAGTFRDADSTAKLNSGNLTEKVLFRLALPSDTSKNASFNLELVKGGQTVFRQSNLRVYQNPSGQELKVILPKSVLSKGNYQIKLSNGANYGFAVE
jgi:hypothetical protein